MQLSTMTPMRLVAVMSQQRRWLLLLSSLLVFVSSSAAFVPSLSSSTNSNSPSSRYRSRSLSTRPSPKSSMSSSSSSSSTALGATKTTKTTKKTTKSKKTKKSEKTVVDATSMATSMPTFKKGEFVSSVSEKTGLSKADSEKALAAVLETIAEEVSQGKRISLLGFGSFKLSFRSARKGRNPQTGDEIDIPASYSPSFTASKSFKERVNEGKR